MFLRTRPILTSMVVLFRTPSLLKKNRGNSLKHVLVVLLAVSVLAGSVWPAEVVFAQQNTDGRQYGTPPPTAAPPEAPAGQEQYAPPPAGPPPQEQAAPTPTAAEPAPAAELAPAAEPARQEEPGPSLTEPSPSVGQYAEDPLPPQPPTAESAAVEAQEEPSTGAQSTEPPIPAKHSSLQDESLTQPPSHCGGGLFDTGPSEGVHCPVTAPSTPDAADQYQYARDGGTAPGEAGPYQYAPAEEPAVEPQATQPVSLPNETPSRTTRAGGAGTGAPAGEPASEELPPAYYYYTCPDTGTCGLDVPDGYVCEQVFAEGVSPVSGKPERYECTQVGDTFDFEYVEGPNGESCLEVLRFEDQNSEGVPGYWCQDESGTVLCDYNANWVEQECRGATPDEEATNPLLCGEDDCGLNVPPGYECTERFGTYQYECSNPNGDMVTSPHGSRCNQTLYFRDANDSSPMIRYACDEPETIVNDLPYCGYYDSNWRPIPCIGGGGVGAGLPAQTNADEAEQVISEGREPGGLLALLNGQGSGNEQRDPRPASSTAIGRKPTPSRSPQELAMLGVLGDTSAPPAPKNLLADAAARPAGLLMDAFLGVPLGGDSSVISGPAHGARHEEESASLKTAVLILRSTRTAMENGLSSVIWGRQAALVQK